MDDARVEPHKAEITDVSVEDNTMQFTLRNTSDSVANALRRVIIAEVPCLAIDLVEIEENTSVLHDEFIAQRLGLIPIRYTGPGLITEHFYLDDDEAGDSESMYDVTLSLDVRNGASENRLVTSRDLHIVPLAPAHHYLEVAHTASAAEEERLRVDDGMGGTIEPGIIIAKLGQFQHIKLRATAKLGFGKMHAKYIPVSTCVMRYVPEIRINVDAMDRLSTDRRREFVARCQPGVFEYVEESATVRVADAMRATNADEIIKIGRELCAEDDNIVSVTMQPETYMFDIETTGALTPMQVLRSALGVLHGKMSTIRDEIIKAAGGGGCGGGGGGGWRRGGGDRGLLRTQPGRGLRPLILSLRGGDVGNMCECVCAWWLRLCVRVCGGKVLV